MRSVEIHAKSDEPQQRGDERRSDDPHVLLHGSNLTHCPTGISLNGGTEVGRCRGGGDFRFFPEAANHQGSSRPMSRLVCTGSWSMRMRQAISSGQTTRM